MFTFLRGMAIGIANIIPGVSGGTMALILGIYERLIGALNNISIQTVKVALGALRFDQSAKKALAEEFRRIDAGFLILLFGGAIAAIGATAKLITYLLETQHDPTYGLFFGLVFVSILVPIKMMKRFSVAPLLTAVVACALVLALGMSMSGQDRLDAAKTKLEIKQAEQAQGEQAVQSRFTTNPVVLAGYALAGAIAISAMILPGISGSFLLLVMGIYFEVLAAIVRMDLPFIAAFALGCGVGLLAFTRLLHLLLSRFRDPTVGFLLGLMIGSLYTLWPFKESAVVGDETIYLANRLPEMVGFNELTTLSFFIIGCLIVAIFLVIEKKMNIEE